MANVTIPSVPAIVSEIELVYSPKPRPAELPQVSNAAEIHTLLIQTWDMNTIHLTEQFKVVLMNHDNRVLGICNLSSGGITGTIADIRLIFALALKSTATHIVIAHNHPSGNLSPSQQDIKISERIAQAGLLLEIPLLDSLIITSETYLSLSHEGLL